MTLLKAQDKKKDKEYKAIANQLAEIFKMYVVQYMLKLSHYALSHQEIDEKHL